jgi:hypothetical protein
VGSNQKTNVIWAKKEMKRKGTILTREKALEFSSGVLTEVATGEADFHPLFKTGVEYEYARNPVKEIDITEAVKPRSITTIGRTD